MDGFEGIERGGRGYAAMCKALAVFKWHEEKRREEKPRREKYIDLSLPCSQLSRPTGGRAGKCGNPRQSEDYRIPSRTSVRD